jgi:hypothetical protein
MTAVFFQENQRSSSLTERRYSCFAEVSICLLLPTGDEANTSLTDSIDRKGQRPKD